MEGQTKVLCLHSLGYLYQPVGRSPNSVSTHRFRDMDSTNISRPASRLLTGPPEDIMLEGVSLGSLMYLFLLAAVRVIFSSCSKIVP